MKLRLIKKESSERETPMGLESKIPEFETCAHCKKPTSFPKGMPSERTMYHINDYGFLHPHCYELIRLMILADGSYPVSGGALIIGRRVIGKGLVIEDSPFGSGQYFIDESELAHS